MPVKNRFAELLPEITSWRRDLHENPEILFETHRTSALVADKLREFDCDEVVTGAETGVELDCNMYLLREFAADQYGQKARNAALVLSGWINGRQFGPATKPAKFAGAEEATWMKDGKALASHSVWRVSFSQIVGVGADPFAPPADAPLLHFSPAT